MTGIQIKKEEKDPNPSTRIQKKMEDTEDDQEIEKVQKNKEHIDQSPTLIDRVHKKDTINLTQEVNTIM